MGKAANIVKDRRCLVCDRTLLLTSKGMLHHARECAIIKRLKAAVNRKA